MELRYISTGTVNTVQAAEKRKITIPIHRALMYIFVESQPTKLCSCEIPGVHFPVIVFADVYKVISVIAIPQNTETSKYQTMGWVYLLVLIVIITIALLFTWGALQKSNSQTPQHYEPVVRKAALPSPLDPYFDTHFPIMPSPPDYLSSTFAYRYKDSFVYEASPDQLFKVYPLCCDTCKASAQREIKKQQTLLGVSGLAKLFSIERYAEPPRDQGQARDEISYIVFRVEKITLFPKIRDITASDLQNLMQTSLDIAHKLGEKIKDMSIANVGRLHNGALGFQHCDDTSPVGPGELNDKPDGARENFNLFYNRYNVLKHIPDSSFKTMADLGRYKAMLDLIRESNNHDLDFPSFLKSLA
jgi:hypothetical protein